MHRRAIMSAIIPVLLLISTAPAAETQNVAAQAFQEGKTLLARADFEAALQAFRSAAEADRENGEYREAFAILRQVMRFRELTETEKDPERWMAMAQGLRMYYQTNGIQSEALAIGKEMHRRQPGADTAVMLAETQMAMGQYPEAAELLRTLGPDQATPRTQVMLALATAKQGRLDEAKGLVPTDELDETVGPQCFYELACLKALLGDKGPACAALARSFQLTPPGQLEAAKAGARACVEFKSMVSSEEFENALATASTVKESKCSGGTACGKCPSRKTCGGEKEKEGEPCKDKKGS